MEERINTHWERLSPALRGKTAKAAITAYYAANPELEGSASDLDDLRRERKATVEQVHEIIRMHADLRLPDVYTLSTGDAVTAYGGAVDPTALTAVLDRWSLSFGALAADDPEHFFMGNPIWRKPLIVIGDGQYLCPIINLGLSFCLELVEDLVGQDPDLLKRYEDRRADYLENTVAALFRAGVPGAHLHQGVLWSDPADPATVYENDLVLTLDSLVLVVESKAGHLTDPARRGAPKRAEHDIANLVITPARQARRLSDFLRTHPGVHTFETKSGAMCEIGTSRVADISSVSVTLDALGTLGARWTELREAGLIDSTEELAPTIPLADLEIIFDILETPAERLHYLTRRAEFERSASYAGDELDLLAFYLDAGFAIGDREFDGTYLTLLGMSRVFDGYYMRETVDPPASKPTRRLTSWWKAILDRLESRRRSGWLSMSLRLLDISLENQRRFEQSFHAAGQRLRKHWERYPAGITTTLVFGGPNRPSALLGLSFRHVKPPAHVELVRAAIDRAATEQNTNRILVIGSDIARNDYPYGLLACPDLDGQIEREAAD